MSSARPFNDTHGSGGSYTPPLPPPALSAVGRACVLHQPRVSVCLRFTRAIVAVFKPAADADGKISLFLCRNAQTDASRVHSCRPNRDKVRARCLGLECGRAQTDVFVCAFVCACNTRRSVRKRAAHTCCALAAVVHLSTHTHAYAHDQDVRQQMSVMNIHFAHYLCVRA